MRKIKTKNYLILGSGYLGVDKPVVSVFNQVAKRYGADVIHAGPLIKRKDYTRARKNFNTINNLLLEEINVIQNISQHFPKIEFLLPLMSSVSWYNTVRAQIAGMDEEEATEYLGELFKDTMGAEDVSDRLDDMITDSVSDFMRLPAIPKNAKITMEYYKLLSEHIGVSSVQPKRENDTRKPASDRVMDEYRKYASNWILPFPTPEVEAKAKLGLNKTNNYWFTGCMYKSQPLAGFDEYYKTDHLPSAVLVIVNTETGEFDTRHIHIEYGDKLVFAVDDGIVFLESKSFEVGTEDNGMFVTDGHAPYHHPGTLGAARALNVLHKPQTFIDGGDTGEGDAVHRHNRKNNQKSQLEGKRIVNDMLAIAGFLAALTKDFPSIKKKILIDSNHMNWYEIYTSEHPELKGMTDLASLYARFIPDWDAILPAAGENKKYHFGDMLIRHGHQEKTIRDGIKLAKHFKYLCGHHHSRKKFKRGQQIGTAAGLGAGFLNNAATAWQSSVATLTKFKGIASAADKIILHDDAKKKSRFAYRDTFYEVDWYYTKESALKV